MDFNLSDIKFPKFVTGITDQAGEWFQGGYDYQTQSPGWVRYFVINEVKEINLADMTWHTTAERHAESDWYPVYTFPNGYEIRIKGEFTQLPDQSQYFYGIQANWFDLDGNALGNDHVSDAGYSGFASNSGYYNIAYGNMDDGNFIGYMILDTVYYPDANPAVGAPNHGLQLQLLVGNKEYGWVVNPGAGPIRATGGIASLILGGWTDLQKFSTYIHSHGNPFNGDPFSDEEFPGEPAGGGDVSGTGGGEGNYEDTSDPIDFPDLPTGGALTSGMIKGFVMNSGNLIGLQSKLWDMSFFDIITQYQKLINDPINCIISLHCLPVTPPESAQPEEIKLGSFPTTISANRVTAQYVEVDGGTIHVNEYWGSALDYAPFTNVEMYVPFCGFKNIQVEDIQGLDLHLKYHVDCFTGDCVAYLKCGASVLYSWTGNCKGQIPCTANSNDLLANQIAPLGAVGLGIVTGNPASTAAGAISGAVNSATAKNHVQRSGEVAGYSGLMSEFNAYLVFHRPRQSLAKNYKNMRGYACNITYKLNQVKGFTMVDYVHLKGISGATDTELAEIEALLKEGVII